MAVRKILLLGNDNLYRVCSAATKSETENVKRIIRDLHETMTDFRRRFGYGRAIAAPQIDEPYRIICMDYDGKTVVFINPRLEFHAGSDMFELWDDCMSFPGLEVKVRRHRTCTVHYLDENWMERTMEAAGDLSELIQHEYDHLDGILAVQRAIDAKSFRLNPERAKNF